ncbi:MAG: hypothetical protein LBT54_03945 [Bifidobacteriaceae bacterium]|nr:hypothetical protein [Bifidobacteriaceae bacterium]
MILLAAEIVFLRDLPNDSTKRSTKMGDVKRVLSWMANPREVPPALSNALLELPGAFGGGMGYNQYLWKQIPWYARFTVRWAALPEGRKEEARRDPWVFHRIVSDDSDDVPMGRNVMLFLAFPLVFEPIVNDQHKRRIRDSFADSIGGPTGDGMAAIDRDILAIRSKLASERSEPFDFYEEPWSSLWHPKKLAKTDERAWLVRTGPDGQAVAAGWLDGGFVSLAAAHLGALEPGATKEQVQARIHEGYEHVEYPQRRAMAEDYYAFLTQMREGDAVVARHDASSWVGRIVGAPTFTEESPRLRRDVEWAEVDVPVAGLPPAGRRPSGEPAPGARLDRSAASHRSAVLRGRPH